MNADLQKLLAALPLDDAPDDEALALALVSQRAIPTGRMARLWTLGTMQAQIAAAYASMWVSNLFAGSDAQRLQLVETHLAAAMRLVGGMVYLRGAVMKVGQALAAYPNLVPEEIASTLERLHFNAPPMHFALVREQLENELERSVGEAFAEFDEREPLLHSRFDFGDAEHLRIGIDIMARAVTRRYTRSHPMQLYLSRTLIGLRSLLHRMRARVPVRDIHMRELQRSGWTWVNEMSRSTVEL